MVKTFPVAHVMADGVAVCPAIDRAVARAHGIDGDAINVVRNKADTRDFRVNVLKDHAGMSCRPRRCGFNLEQFILKAARRRRASDESALSWFEADAAYSGCDLP